MLCVWWDQEGVIYYELLKPDETVNAHRCHQQLIKLHRALREKRPHYRKRHDKLIFLYDMHHRIRQQWSKITWRHSIGKCCPIPLTHQTWHLLTITCFRRWATLAELRFLRRCPKMVWWVICLERWGIFLTWYTQIARKMGKMYS